MSFSSAHRVADVSRGDSESGYASASSSREAVPDVYFTPRHLKFLNRQLQQLEPEGRLLSHRISSFWERSPVDAATDLRWYRDSTMVHRLSSFPLSDYGLWPIGSSDPGHALQAAFAVQEQPRRSRLPRYAASFPRDALAR